jgi:hypothetical protein
VDLLKRGGHSEVRHRGRDQGQQFGLPGEGWEFVVPDAAEELARPLAQVGRGPRLPPARHVLQDPVGVEQDVPDRRCRHRSLATHPTMITGPARSVNRIPDCTT